MRTRSVAHLIVVATIAAGPFVTPASAADSTSHVGSLEAAVVAGKLDRRVVQQLKADGQTDALVTLDDRAILRRALAQAPEGRKRAEAVLEVTMPAYRAQKARVIKPVDGDLEIRRNYPALDTAFVRFRSEGALARVASDPEVTGIRENRTLEPQLAESLALINQPRAVQRWDGTGTSVAVLDTGVDYTHSAFGSCTSPGVPAGCRVPFAQDFAPDDGVLDSGSKHGTNVAGIVAGTAPGTKILALDVFNGGGAAEADIIDAINWTVANQGAYKISALNMSLGVPGSYNVAECGGNAYETAFSNARAVGILPVVAAGNSAEQSGAFTNGVAYPSCAPGAVRVGAVYDADVGSQTYATANCTDATTAADQITCFSQSAPILTVLAPGAKITAAGLTKSGTSMAAPHVAGAAAVLADEDPSATVDRIQYAISNSGNGITDPRNGVTKKRLDLLDAVRLLPKAGHAYAWVNDPWAANSTPSATYQFNSAGGDITVDKLGVGVHRVNIPNLGGPGGSVHVSAYGGSSQHCKVSSWSQWGTTQRVYVRCYDGAGSAVDTRFTVSFSRPYSSSGPMAFVWANQASADDYTPSLKYQYHSSGFDNTIKRNGIGNYTVRLPLLGASAGHVQVTAYGSGPETCKVQSWGSSGGWFPSQLVNVRCFDQAGAAADERFTMTYIRDTSLSGWNCCPWFSGTRSGYVWANNATASSYTPNLSYQYNSAGMNNTIEKPEGTTGQYKVVFTGLDLSKGHVQVTAYGSDSHRCKVAHWSGDTAWIKCYDASGSLVDTRFDAHFLSSYSIFA